MPHPERKKPATGLLGRRIRKKPLGSGMLESTRKAIEKRRERMRMSGLTESEIKELGL